MMADKEKGSTPPEVCPHKQVLKDTRPPYAEVCTACRQVVYLYTPYGP